MKAIITKTVRPFVIAYLLMFILIFISMAVFGQADTAANVSKVSAVMGGLVGLADHIKPNALLGIPNSAIGYVLTLGILWIIRYFEKRKLAAKAAKDLQTLTEQTNKTINNLTQPK